MRTRLRLMRPLKERRFIQVLLQANFGFFCHGRRAGKVTPTVRTP